MLPDPDPQADHGAGEPGAGPVPSYLLPDGAAVDPAGRLSIAGVDVLDLCEEFGTPVFVYDEEHLRRRCREAVAAWGGGVAYASKAFLCRAMARLAHEEGMCIDVSTGGELHVALAAGVPGARLVLHGNNKSDAELARALDAGVGPHRGRLVRRDRPPGAVWPGASPAVPKSSSGSRRASRPTPTSM